ncbi:MAG: sigma-E processing peptidase SpoIIGA [Oscillospiraceae bacterium]|nr:sigma-E processing peptidase SpoIIGA [Oscillospiraceae bacterium]
MTVYIDSVFVLNFATDYLILLIAARMAGGVIHRKRLAAGALVGAVYAAAVFLPGFGFLSLPASRIAALAGMTLAAFWREDALARKILLTACVAAAFAGAVMALAGIFRVYAFAGSALYFSVDWKIMAISFAVCYAALRFGVCASARLAGRGGKLMPVEITAFGNTVSLTALCDSGNTLTDPVSGQNVLVADADTVCELLPEAMRNAMTHESLAHPSLALEAAHLFGYGGRFRLLPYRSVGVEDGLLLVMRPDDVRIGDTNCGALPVAFSPTAISGGVYGALWGGKEQKE